MSAIISQHGPSLLVSTPFMATAPRAQRSGLGIGASHADGHEVAAMESVYRRVGGLASGDAVALRLRHFVDQPISTLARWIVTRTVVSFTSQSQTLLPLFQFDLSDMLPCAATAEVIRELSAVFDDRALAMWFAQPNWWLDGATPVGVVARDQRAVLQAARADKARALAS